MGEEEGETEVEKEEVGEAGEVGEEEVGEEDVVEDEVGEKGEDTDDRGRRVAV